MISFKQFLIESQNYPLYHGTSPSSAIAIFRDNVLNAGFYNPDLHWPSKEGKVVSFTRSLSFAKQWRDRAGVVLEFDRQKLRNSYKLVPFNFFGYSDGDWENTGKARWMHTKRFHTDFSGLDKNQYEEVAIKPIKNVVSYIKKVHISTALPSKNKDPLVDFLNSKNISYEFYDK